MNTWDVIKAQSKMNELSLPALIAMARPKGWQFWISEAKRCAALDLIGLRGQSDRAALECVIEIIRNDRSIDVRRWAVRGLSGIVVPSELDDATFQTCLAALIGQLQTTTNDNEASGIVRAIGKFGPKARDAEKAIRAFLQKRLTRMPVDAGVMLWSSFALAAVSDDYEKPVEALAIHLNGDELKEVREAIKSVPKVALSPTDSVALFTASAGEVDANLIDSNAISKVVEERFDQQYRMTPLVQGSRVATAVARRKMEVLQALELLGERALPLLPRLIELRPAQHAKKITEKFDALISALTKIAPPESEETGRARQLFEDGKKAFKVRNFATVKALMEQVLAEIPDHPNAQFLLGASLFELGDVDGAIPRLQIAARGNPNHADIQNALGMALGRVDRFEEAETHMARAAFLGHPQAREVLANTGMDYCRTCGAPHRAGASCPSCRARV